MSKYKGTDWIKSESPAPEHRAVVDAIRAVDDAASDSLHRVVEAIARPRASGRAQRRQARLSTGLIGGLVAVMTIALSFVFAKPFATPNYDSVAEVAARSADGPAPVSDASRPVVFTKGVGGVRFPDWYRPLGWRATGSREDTVGHRDVSTVSYESTTGFRVGYSIVSGPALPLRGGSQTIRSGVALRFFIHDGQNVVTWRRGGHTCILTGKAVPPPVLAKLAAYENELMDPESAS